MVDHVHEIAVVSNIETQCLNVRWIVKPVAFCQGNHKTNAINKSLMSTNWLYSSLSYNNIKFYNYTIYYYSEFV